MDEELKDNNVFLRVSIDENGFPFPVELRKPESESVLKKRAEATKKFVAFTKANPIYLGKDYKFNREELYDRKVFR